MKTKKEVNVVMRGFAAFMRSFMPLVCVLFFTKKTSKTAELFVASPFWEKLTMKMFRFSSQDIQKRVWSLQTRCWLLENGKDDLLLDVRTAQEFDLIFVVKGVTPQQREEWLLKALSVYTPNRELASKLFEFLTPDGIRKAVETQAGVFDVIATKLAGMCGKSVEYEAKLKELIWLRPNTFCEMAMQQIMKTPPQKLTEQQRKFFSFCCVHARKAGVCLVQEIAYIRAFFPEKYKEIRQKAFGEGTHFSKYFALLFPKILSSMGRENAVNSTEAKEEVEAKLWYEAACLRLHDAEVRRTMVSVYSLLKRKLSEMSFDQLTKNLIISSNEVCTLTSMLTHASEALKPEIRAELAAYGARAAGCFPFNGWEPKNARKVLKAMAFEGRLLDTQLRYLSEDLRQYAVVMLEKAAQVAYAEKVDCDGMADKELCEEAEIVFVRSACYHGFRAVSAFEEYMNKYSLKEGASLYLLREYSNTIYGRRLISHLVKISPLTRREYEALLTSSCKDLAISCRLEGEEKTEAIVEKA